MAGGAGVRLAWLAIGLSLVLAGCGKKGLPEPPGPADQIIYPRAYPTH